MARSFRSIASTHAANVVLTASEYPAVHEAPSGAPAWMTLASSGGIASSARWGVRLALGATVGVWLTDVTFLASARATLGTTAWLAGLGSALFVGASAAAVLGAVLGPIAMPSARRLFDVIEKTRRDLFDERVEVRRAQGRAIVAGMGLLGLWGWLAYRAAFAIGLEFARPESIAAALAVSQIGLAGLLVLAWPSAMSVAAAFLRTLSRVPGLRRVAAEAYLVPSLLGATAVGVGLFLLARHGAEVSAVPWRTYAPLVGAMPGIALAREWSALRKGARTPIALLALVVLAGGVVAFRLRPEQTAIRTLAFERAMTGRFGYSLWTAAFDFDGDGQLGMLGGGDCAPFDSKRHTGAIDIPGNGIDEDCDGADMTNILLEPRPRIQVGQLALPRQPTIVLLTIDALAGSRLASANGRSPLMPHLEELAEGSAVFTHCFSQGPSTRLSFPSIFTSRWDSQLAHLFAPTLPHSLATSERQIQDILNDAGYETAAVIPSAYFDAGRWSSMTRGFQRVDSSAVAAGKNNSVQVTDAALRVLSTSTDRPLYMWVHYYDAHAPYERPPGTDLPLSTEQALYEAELSFVDREVGRLVTAIESRPEPVYLFLTADHATVFHPDPASRRGHYGYDLYTATLHVPLVVHGPRIAPSKIDGIVSTMDIVPTIVDGLHLDARSEMEGTSLWPEILAGVRDDKRVLFHEFYLPERDFRGDDPLRIVSVRSPKYNLVLDRVRGSYELYDWTTDYFERHDIYGNEAASPEVLRLRSLLGAFVHQFHRRAPDRASIDRSAAAPPSD